MRGGGEQSPAATFYFFFLIVSQMGWTQRSSIRQPKLIVCFLHPMVVWWALSSCRRKTLGIFAGSTKDIVALGHLTALGSAFGPMFELEASPVPGL